mmetsp:Transcript_79327/g.116277  ORF Transcript_79327/g.116277 Transcript_79327/m.116277 type:complete len:100 (+) Transcript_79327:507-806(+)
MVMHVVYFSSGKRVLISQNGVILKLGIVIRLSKHLHLLRHIKIKNGNCTNRARCNRTAINDTILLGWQQIQGLRLTLARSSGAGRNNFASCNASKIGND